jgi:hypothetical protein
MARGAVTVGALIGALIVAVVLSGATAAQASGSASHGKTCAWGPHSPLASVVRTSPKGKRQRDQPWPPRIKSVG